MKTIRAIFRDGRLEPLDPVNLPENTRVTIAVIEGDDLPADAIANLAAQGGAFDFLSDPREDIYTAADGEPV
jgi:predicted DNA-binding antitoxin AbrB/MazE fold protein